MIIFDIISWIWRYLIYSLILGVMGGWQIKFYLGYTGIQGGISLMIHRFCPNFDSTKIFDTNDTCLYTRPILVLLDILLNIKSYKPEMNWTGSGSDVDRKWTNLSRAYVRPNVFSLLFWRKWWRSFEVRHSHIGFHLDKIESIHHLDMIWKYGLSLELLTGGAKLECNDLLEIKFWIFNRVAFDEFGTFFE